MQSDFFIDTQLAKNLKQLDSPAPLNDVGTPLFSPSSASSVESDSPDDPSNPELMKDRYFPKIPLEHEAEFEDYFTWSIENWKDLKENKITSPRFKINDFEWNLLIFPRGNGGSHLSVYLEPHPPSTTVPLDTDDNSVIGISDDEDEDEENLISNNEKENESKTKEVPIDPNWHLCSQFVIDMWNPKYPDTHKFNVSQHRFSSNETDWGFGNFVELSSLFSLGKMFKHPLISDNKVNFTIYIRGIKDHTGVLWHNFINYDSKKETGFVGINNQGATCYLNSLLQSYYFTSLFRKKVYQIPTQDESVNNENDEVVPQTKSVSLALQRLFYQLQTSDMAIDTNELTLSFGWDSSEAFTQHDVQEMNRILMDRLENKMKGTEIEGCLSDIFVGKMKSFIRCINVDYESSRTEDFWDIQLNVKGLKDLKESFANYIELETLTGENQYDASGFGLQDAEKGVVFESFPPVLHLQLKRFEYDFTYDQLFKINDRHEFMDSIDLKPYLDPSSPVTSEDWIYDLHGVLVHTGDISTGHYYALIKPTEEDQWFRFDDDRVWNVIHNDVFEENFGCDRKSEQEIRSMTRLEQVAYQNRRHTSLYMLVYIRRNKAPEILGEVDEKDIPPHIPEQVAKEREEEERRRKEIEEMQFYANFKLITNKSYMNYQGFDLCPDENSKLYYANDIYEDLSYPLAFKLEKKLSASELFNVVSELLGDIDPHQFRLWIVSNRKNGTSRPDLPIGLDFDNVGDNTVDDIFELRDYKRNAICTLYVEELHKSLKVLSKSIISKASKGDEKTFDLSVLSNDKDIDSTTLIDHFENVVDGLPIDSHLEFPLIETDSQDILLLLKYYDPDKAKLMGFTHVVVNRDSYTGSLVKYIQVFMNWSFSTEVLLYEEVQPNSIQLIDSTVSFAKSELHNGDIICFAKASNGVDGELEFPTIPSFYKFLRYRVHLSIRPLLKIDEDTEEYVDLKNTDKEVKNAGNHKELDFWVILSISFKELAAKIGREINVDPNYIRVFGIYSNDKSIPISSHTHLQQLLGKNVPQSSLFNFGYEILNITVQELENMKLMKVYWLSHGVVHYQEHELLIPRNGTVKDLNDKLLGKLKLDDTSRKSIFMYTTLGNRINRVLSPDMSISPIDSQRYVIYGGCYPELHAAMGTYQMTEMEKLQIIKDSIDSNTLQHIQFPTQLSDIRVTYLFQFYKDFENRHGIPFVFLMIKGEKFKHTKMRLQNKIGLGEKEFAKVKIAVSPLYGEWKPKYLVDDECEIFDELGPEDHLALDHPDRTSRRTSNFERAIFIKD